MRRYSLLGAGVGAVVVAVTGIALAGDARRAGAASGSGGAAEAPGRYSLQVLPETRGQWLVLDTQTGEVRHWSVDGTSYVVTTIDPRRTGKYALVTDTIRGGPAR